MGAGASQSKNEDLYDVGIRTPTAPPIPLNNKQKSFNANNNIQMAKVLGMYNKLSNYDKKDFINRTHLPRYIFTEFNKASPEVQNAVIRGNTHALLTERPLLNPNNLPAGGRMKLKKRRATKKTHKNKRRHSRRN